MQTKIRMIQYLARTKQSNSTKEFLAWEQKVFHLKDWPVALLQAQTTGYITWWPWRPSWPPTGCYTAGVVTGHLSISADTSGAKHELCFFFSFFFFKPSKLSAHNCINQIFFLAWSSIRALLSSILILEFQSNDCVSNHVAHWSLLTVCPGCSICPFQWQKHWLAFTQWPSWRNNP